MFDPYAKWLGITKRVGAPNQFELLGLPTDIDDADVIANDAGNSPARPRFKSR